MNKEKNDAQKNYEEAIAFRESMNDSINKMAHYFIDCNDAGDLKKICYDKLYEFNNSWSSVIIYYLTELEVEKGIVKFYHPINRIAETLQNRHKMQEKRIEDLEKEIDQLKEKNDRK